MNYIKLYEEINENKICLTSNTEGLLKELEIKSHPVEDNNSVEKLYSTPFIYQGQQQDALLFFCDLYIFMAPQSFKDKFLIKVKQIKLVIIFYETGFF